MDRSQPESSTGGDRLSQLEDRVLGNILSFLPAKEAARGALLSSRWRHIFAAVHTVSLEEPESPIPERDDNFPTCGCPSCVPPPDPNAPPPFHSTVSAAIIARQRRRGAVPLRALRVAVETYSGRREDSTLDQWVSYAVQQAAPDGLDLELRLWCRLLLCQRPYKLYRVQHKTSAPIGNSAVDTMPAPAAREPDVFEYVPTCPPRARSPDDAGSEFNDVRSGDYERQWRSYDAECFDCVPAPLWPPGSPADAGSEPNDDNDGDDDRSVVRSDDNDDDDNIVPAPAALESNMFCHVPPGPPADSDDDDGSVVRSDDGERQSRPYYAESFHEYTVPGALFSCAELRSLSLSSCRLAAPATVNLPSLVTLLLSHVPDAGADVERLIARCPRLADLTLEACDAVTALSVPGGARLSRLALRCCHNLATVAFDSSELRVFEYRGDVPEAAFLTMHGGAGRIAYCKVDICGVEVTSEEKLIDLRRLLQLFVNAEHLHLESARLGSGFDKDVRERLATFSSLRHLEMRGCLPDDDTGVIDAMSRILEHAPNLEALSLAFRPHDEHSCPDDDDDYSWFREAELLDGHHLSYDPLSVLTAPSAAIPCLRSRVREINLVHYHGGTAQRTLAKFLLCNAPAIDKLWCEFAEGLMWTQLQLMHEIKGWLINKSASTHFA